MRVTRKFTPVNRSCESVAIYSGNTQNGVWLNYHTPVTYMPPTRLDPNAREHAGLDAMVHGINSRLDLIEDETVFTGVISAVNE